MLSNVRVGFSRQAIVRYSAPRSAGFCSEIGWILLGDRLAAARGCRRGEYLTANGSFPLAMTHRCQIVIPARLGSTRLAEKLLLRAGGKSILQHTFEAASRATVAGAHSVGPGE